MGVAICNECVDLCAEIFAEDRVGAELTHRPEV